MATVEVIISIKLDDDATSDDMGIASDAEVLYDEIFYVHGDDASHALSGAEDALHDALVACHVRAGILT